MVDSMENKKIQTFMDLRVWQEGHAIVMEIYKITKNFPRDEQFGLTSQMRRAAVSITSNIAEGFGRQSRKEKVQFYAISQGSTLEIQNQLLIARDAEYITHQVCSILFEKLTILSKSMSALILAIRRSISGSFPSTIYHLPSTEIHG